MGEEDALTVDQNSYNGGEASYLRNNNPSPHLSSKGLTLPTVLTLGRVAALSTLIAGGGELPQRVSSLQQPLQIGLTGTLRDMRSGSAFGAFLDPVADKLMVAATLILLCTKPMDALVLGPVPWLVTVPSIAIIGREITMSAVREWAASQNGKLSKAVAVNSLGKWKTATQMIALTILLASRDSSLERLLPPDCESTAKEEVARLLFWLLRSVYTHRMEDSPSAILPLFLLKKALEDSYDALVLFSTLGSAIILSLVWFCITSLNHVAPCSLHTEFY
ncbi:hypothetical protein YC2023_077614 [Brassica napus]